jgi:unsaturated rhamnogalacturonyl hydrolase
MKPFLLLPLLALLASGCATGGARRLAHFQDWPAGMSPAEVGPRVAENFLARELDYEDGSRPYVIYPEVISWYGSLEVARLTRQAALQEKFVRKFDRFLTPEGAKHISPAEHVDYHVFGAVPLEIHLLTQDKKYLELGQGFADRQWAKTTPDGLTAEARYWVDDIYMISLVQVQAYRATRDPKYLDHAALTAVLYLNRLQQPNGLFFHAEDTPFFWSRGNGWFAAGIAELLSELPASHPQRPRILAGFQKMMATLLATQSPEGLWRQLVDRPEAWLETSGTGMFAFAMVTGVKHGWLEADTYGPAARKAWLALVAKLDAQANVSDVCIGTNTAVNQRVTEPAAQLKYYLDRGRANGDLHGQAPILWTAMALLR